MVFEPSRAYQTPGGLVYLSGLSPARDNGIGLTLCTGTRSVDRAHRACCGYSGGESPDCCCDCRAYSCCDSRRGRWPVCCSSCRPDSRAWHLLCHHPRPIESEKSCLRADRVSAWAILAIMLRTDAESKYVGCGEPANRIGRVTLQPPNSHQVHPPNPPRRSLVADTHENLNAANPQPD